MQARSGAVSQAAVTIYNARGNVYAVARPDAVLPALPADAADAALTVGTWSDALLRAMQIRVSQDIKLNGVIIGPFNSSAPYEVLILNTDGSLAERSGNGLTIFGRALVDSGQTDPRSVFVVRVHHAGRGARPLETTIEVAPPNAALVKMGTPAFGPEAVGATPVAAATLSGQGWVVRALAGVNPLWTRSVLVRVGNPHCVTFVSDPRALPSKAEVQKMASQLRGIADACVPSDQAPFERGINLQWARVIGSQKVEARVFERGEGWTESSGTSASAVACAAFKMQLVSAGEISVRMPGGVARLSLTASRQGALDQVVFTGRARRVI